MPQTTRLAIPYPAGTDPADVPADLQAIADRLASVAAGWLPPGTLDARPAPAAALDRHLYFAHDTDELFMCVDAANDGSFAWETVGAQPDLSGYATTTALNNGLAGKLDKAGGTVTGDLVVQGKTTLGDANQDVVRRKALEVETHTRNVTNTYTNGQLTQVVEKDGATTVKTTTLTYTGDQLTTVTEVADGLTVTTTLNYDGSGNLTGTTRTVA